MRMPVVVRSLRLRRLGALLLVSVLLGGCGSPGQTTRMTADDMIQMSGEMAQSLLASDALAGRGPESEAWIVSIDRVLNLSTDVMSRSEQWAVVARLQGQLPLQALAHQKNVHFVMPPERVSALRAEGRVPELALPEFGRDRPTPTHTMTATFRTVTRAQARQRMDMYYCEFELIDMRTYEPVWQDRFEYKREARGHIWN